MLLGLDLIETCLREIQGIGFQNHNFIRCSNVNDAKRFGNEQVPPTNITFRLFFGVRFMMHLGSLKSAALAVSILVLSAEFAIGENQSDSSRSEGFQVGQSDTEIHTGFPIAVPTSMPTAQMDWNSAQNFLGTESYRYVTVGTIEAEPSPIPDFTPVPDSLTNEDPSTFTASTEVHAAGTSGYASPTPTPIWNEAPVGPADSATPFPTSTNVPDESSCTEDGCSTSPLPCKLDYLKVGPIPNPALKDKCDGPTRRLRLSQTNRAGLEWLVADLIEVLVNGAVDVKDVAEEALIEALTELLVGGATMLPVGETNPNPDIERRLKGIFREARRHAQNELLLQSQCAFEPLIIALYCGNREQRQLAQSDVMSYLPLFARAEFGPYLHAFTSGANEETVRTILESMKAPGTITRFKAVLEMHRQAILFNAYADLRLLIMSRQMAGATALADGLHVYFAQHGVGTEFSSIETGALRFTWSEQNDPAKTGRLFLGGSITGSAPFVRPRGYPPLFNWEAGIPGFTPYFFHSEWDLEDPEKL